MKRQPSEWEKNNSKWNKSQRINSQNIQAAHTTQCQKNRQPNKNVGERPKHISSKKTYIWLTNTWKDAQHHSLFSSVQFSHSVVSNSLWLHESQHTRPPCPSPTPGVHSNSYPSSQWCHPAISSSVVPSPPAPNLPSIRVFSKESTLCMRWLKYWSFSFSIILSKEHPRPISFRMDWMDLLGTGMQK